MNASSNESGASFLPDDENPISHKRRLLRERILEEQSLATEVEQLQRDLEQQTRKISDRSEDTVHAFISSLERILKLDVLVESFVTEQVDFNAENRYDLILFETVFDLEDVVAASRGLEEVDLSNAYEVNILFLKLQTYYALRSEIFNHILTLDSSLVVDFIEGTVANEGKQLLKWDIVLSRGGRLVQNKLTTSEDEAHFLRETLCDKGIHKGVSIFVAQLLNLS